MQLNFKVVKIYSPIKALNNDASVEECLIRYYTDFENKKNDPSAFWKEIVILSIKIDGFSMQLYWINKTFSVETLTAGNSSSLSAYTKKIKTLNFVSLP